MMKYRDDCYGESDGDQDETEFYSTGVRSMMGCYSSSVSPDCR